jgi:hypothetical protein
MPRVRVRLFPKGMIEMLSSRDAADEMLRRARNVAGQAKANAPVVSGEYRASISAEIHKGPTRVVGRTIANVEYAQKVEAQHRVLGRAIDAGRT